MEAALQYMGHTSAPRWRVVVIGGGTGSYNVLSGLKRYPELDLTAIVTMMDDGGSSGRLRDEFGHLPPGDVRRCLIALSPDDRSNLLMRQLFDYRFDRGNGLKGHSFGNLFLTALTEIAGSLDAAIQEAGRLLGIRGTVLPVTLTQASLCARLKDGTVIKGESNIDMGGEHARVGIDHVFLEPTAATYPPVVEAIAQADAIVIGPGDLFTSVIPNLLVEGVPQAVNSSRATKIYVCNLMTKHGETDGYRASDFIRQVQRYLHSSSSLDWVLLNTMPLPQPTLERYAQEEAYPVEVDLEECRGLVPNLKLAPLASEGPYVRHHPARLAEAILEVLRGSPRSRV